MCEFYNTQCDILVQPARRTHRHAGHRYVHFSQGESKYKIVKENWEKWDRNFVGSFMLYKSIQFIQKVSVKLDMPFLLEKM